MESKDIFFTIIGVVTILALLAIFYIGYKRQIKHRIRMAKSMKFFIAFTALIIMAGLDFSKSLNTSFIVIAVACGIGCLWNAIMYND